MKLPDGMDIEVLIGFLLFAIIFIIIIYYLVADIIYMYKQKNKVTPEMTEGKRIRKLIERDIKKDNPKKIKQNIDNNSKRKPILI